ncbi:helix-turn-helix domain-containing protein [Citrobacter koseri]|uniref:helix-turn-helix domain-containing protein n=1 Tax=Citrobacter koseri TaxID=545 RepID=UPI0028BDF40F|nr:helix-turn-helix domain-containing protein [Citrobacter koseri]MDT7485875.1 helix-turn-helix domain-containing protein [Citrobacter koseri]
MMKQNEIDDDFSGRVSSARAARSMTQMDLAAKVGVSQRQIAAYEGSQSKPRKGVLLKLAKSLGVTPEWLAHGFTSSVVNDPDGGIYVASVSQQSIIPIITLGMVADWMASPADDNECSEYHLTSLPVSDKAFAIKNTDAAMSSSGADGYGFPLGAMITFDPSVAVEDSDFVIALFDTGKAIFRQFLTGYGESTLAPLNPRYPTETFRNSIIDEEITLVPAVGVEYGLPSAERLDSINHR